MSDLGMPSTFGSTSAAGPMRWREVARPVLLGAMLASAGASTTCAIPTNMAAYLQFSAGQTTAGAQVPLVVASAGPVIGELRRLSGLTWDQLARLFNVSRRSVHFWASGKPMAPSNEEHLWRLLVVVRKVDRGSARANRAILLGAHEDGILPFDLLAAREYERVLSLLGSGEGYRTSTPKISEDARILRAPQRPEKLVGALQDRIHRNEGTVRVAKSVRIRGGH
ncbi:MAG: XRE family transcriptional regulator [Acidiferrobacter sp.]